MGYSLWILSSVLVLFLHKINGEPRPPLVAFMCNKTTMYMSENGWVADRTTKCIQDPEKILEYCQKVYPGKEITNVVESNELVTIDNWCRFDKPKCHKHNSHTVRPFRCLAHPFITEDDSNLLKVVHNDKKVPKKPVIADNDPNVWKPAPKPKKEHPVENSIFYEHYIQKSKDDAFLNEHEYFFKAKNDLQKHHHDRVTKMMKEWAEARQKVTDMKPIDPRGAEKLNKEITDRFQKTYEALEQEGMAEKKQLIAIHQQRVTADLNDKKRSAMEHYMDTLTDTKADATKILKALKHYIKTEEKDKLHALNHFKHVIDTDPEEHPQLKQRTEAHLNIIEKRIDAAIEMLKRVPDFEKKVRQQTDEYLATFRELDNAISATLSSPKPEKSKPESDSNNVIKPQEPKSEPKQQWEEIKKPVEEKKPVESVKNEIYHEKSEINDEDSEDEHYIPEMKVAHADGRRNDEMEVQRLIQKPVAKSPNFMYTQTTSVVIAVAAIAVFVIIVAGILVLRKRSQRTSRGFVEVDQAASPEERHVANMQMNGYENPTYRYFETQQPA